MKTFVFQNLLDFRNVENGLWNGTQTMKMIIFWVLSAAGNATCWHSELVLKLSAGRLTGTNSLHLLACLP